MWNQYKKTFRVTQTTILAVTGAALVYSHAWSAAAELFCAMQIAAVAGAMWAVRFKHRVLQPSDSRG